MAKGVGYRENIAPADIQKGFVTRPLKIDHHRSFLDTDSCQTITEVIVTDKTVPVVLSTRSVAFMESDLRDSTLAQSSRRRGGRLGQTDGFAGFGAAVEGP